MSVSSKTRIEGVDRAMRNLRNLEPKVARKKMISIFRKSARPMVSAMRSAAPKKTGTLRKSMGIVNAKKSASIYVGPRSGKRYKNDGYYAKFLTPGWNHKTRKRGAKVTPIKGNDFIEKGYKQTIAQVENDIENSIVRELGNGW